MKRSILYMVTFLVGGMVSIIAFLTLFPVAFMDLNLDGRVKIDELLIWLDVGTRVDEGADHYCVQVFSLKDGLPIATHCS